jgi:hypothetical protein
VYLLVIEYSHTFIQGQYWQAFYKTEKLTV